MDDGQRVLHFGAFALDLSRCTVQRDDEEVRLRPKTFEVLKYLASRPGQVVSKEEVFAAVWPAVSVTDDSLVQCIKEIRQALGERGRQVLKTLPRRGYLLDIRQIQKIANYPSIDHEGRFPSATKKFLVARLLLKSQKPWHRRATAAGIASIAAVVFAFFYTRLPPTNGTPSHYAILGTEFANKRTFEDNREAFTLFNKALALDSDNVVALVGYARVLVSDLTEGWAPPQERSMRLDQAEAALQHALRIDAEHPGAHQVLGTLWRVRGEPARAIPELELALRLAPNNAWARSELGRNRLEVGDCEGAIRELETAMLISPREPAMYIWYFQAGMAAVHAGDGKTALNWLQKSEEASPAYRRLVTLWRAIALADLGRDDEARALITQYLSIWPALTVAFWRKTLPNGSELVASQRARIADVLLRIGVPSG